MATAIICDRCETVLQPNEEPDAGVDIRMWLSEARAGVVVAKRDLCRGCRHALIDLHTAFMKGATP